MAGLVTDLRRAGQCRGCVSSCSCGASIPGGGLLRLCSGVWHSGVSAAARLSQEGDQAIQGVAAVLLLRAELAASMIRTPSCVIRVPASAAGRGARVGQRRGAGGVEPQSTPVATLLTFCPPG